MKDRSTIWIALAVVQAVGIAWLVAALWSEPSEPAPQPHAPSQDSGAIAPAIEDDPSNSESSARSAQPLEPRASAQSVAPVDPAKLAASDTGSVVLYGSLRASNQTLAMTSGLLELHAGETADDERLARLVLREPKAYAIPDLNLGVHHLSIRMDGFRPALAIVDIPRGKTTFRHDVIVQPSWLLRVAINTPDGQPLQGKAFAQLRARQRISSRAPVHVVGSLAEPPTALPSSGERTPPYGIGKWIDAHAMRPGHSAPFDLPARFAGQLDLPLDEPMFVSAAFGTAVLATERVDTRQAEVTLVVNPTKLLDSLSAVRVRVLAAEDGKPTTEARVYVSDRSSGGSGVPVNREGRVAIEGLRPEQLEFSVRAPDRIGPQLLLNLVAGETLDLGDVRLSKPEALHLHFEGLAQGARATARLQAIAKSVPPGTQPGEWRVFGSTATPLHASVPPGSYRIIARSGTHHAVFEFNTSTLTDGKVTVRMAQAPTLRISIREPLNLRVLRDDGVQIYSGRFQAPTNHRIPLPIGRYTTEVLSRDGRVQSHAVVQPAAGSAIKLP